MAITVDVASLGTGFSSGAASISLTTGSAVASGGFIVVGASWFGETMANAISSFSGGGLTWSVDKNSSGAESGGKRIGWGSAQAPSGLASSSTITCNFAGGFGGAEIIIGATSLLGVATSSPLDGTPGGYSENAPIAAWTSTALTIQSGSILFAAAVSDNTTTGNSATTGTEAWERFIVGDAYSQAVQYRIEAAGGSYTLAGNFTNNGSIGTAAIAYLAAAAAGPGSGPVSTFDPVPFMSNQRI